MKKKIVIGLSCILIIGIIAFIYINNNNNTVKQYDIHTDLKTLEIKSGRYIILYDSVDKNYVLTTVDKTGLGTDLYILGKEAYNFSINGDKFELSSYNQKYVYSSNGWTKVKTKNNNISTLGLLETSYDSKNKCMQVVGFDKSTSNCQIPIQEYNSYIPIDIINI